MNIHMYIFVDAHYYDIFGDRGAATYCLLPTARLISIINARPQYIRPTVLDHWTAIRVVAPDRSVARFVLPREIT